MKALKYIFFLLLILIIGLSIYIATLDGNYDIKRSKIIKAPIEVVFNTVNDFKKWENWGPWYEIDSTIVASYPNKTSGVGASYTWTGKDGTGTMKTISLIPNKEIIQQIDFGTGNVSEVYWRFSEIDNHTEVIWGMKGISNFGEKLFWLTQGGIEKNMASMYHRGLELLENYLIKEMDKHSFTTVGEVDFGGGYYLYLTTSSKIETIDAKTKEMFPKILEFINQNSIKASGQPFLLTHQWDEINKTTIFSTCIPIKERVITTGDVLTGFLPPQKTFKTILKGDYKYLYQAWENAYKTLVEKGYTAIEKGEPFEVYTVGPNEEPNPANWVTEIYIPIQ